MVSVDVKHHLYLLATRLYRQQQPTLLTPLRQGPAEETPGCSYSVTVHTTHSDDDDEVMFNVLRCQLTY